MKKKWTIQILCMLGILLMFSSCYHRRAHHQMHAAMVEYSNKQLDSISFSTTHHYTNKFNFLVFKDSLELIAQQPEEFLSNLPIDSFAVQKELPAGGYGYSYGSSGFHRFSLGAVGNRR